MKKDYSKGAKTFEVKGETKTEIEEFLALNSLSQYLEDANRG